MQLPQRRLRFGIVAGLCAAAVACFATALVNGRPARAASNPTGEHLTYASPVEILPSKDAHQLYVLCQGTDEVRVLDASTYAEIKAIASGNPAVLTLAGCHQRQDSVVATGPARPSATPAPRADQSPRLRG